MKAIIDAGLINYEDIENAYYSYNEAKEKGIINEDISEEEYEVEAKEIYEYWIVTEWFFNKLKQQNEPVIEWENLYIWGRTTTGQAILLDGVIDEIRKTLN